MATKEEVRPIYSELQGCLSQAPVSDKRSSIRSAEMWQYVNGTIDELYRISGEDYNRFRMVPQKDHVGDEFIDIDIYRTKLNGLIMQLYGRYFSDEWPPFSGVPQTVNIQAQQQSQFVHVQMIMEILNRLDLNIARFPEGSKERRFVDKMKDHLKSGIGGITSILQLVLLILNIATQCGLSVEDMQKIFRG